MKQTRKDGAPKGVFGIKGRPADRNSSIFDKVKDIFG
jgi:hypothetical protein